MQVRDPGGSRTEQRISRVRMPYWKHLLEGKLEVRIDCGPSKPRVSLMYGYAVM